MYISCLLAEPPYSTREREGLAVKASVFNRTSLFDFLGLARCVGKRVVFCREWDCASGGRMYVGWPFVDFEFSLVISRGGGPLQTLVAPGWGPAPGLLPRCTVDFFLLYIRLNCNEHICDEAAESLFVRYWLSFCLSPPLAPQLDMGKTQFVQRAPLLCSWLGLSLPLVPVPCEMVPSFLGYRQRWIPSRSSSSTSSA